MHVSNPTAKLGEEIASTYLKKIGYRIIERNFRKGYGEIDIIATYENKLIFVEVKTRTTNLYGGAIESISRGKIRSLIKTTQFYKMTHSQLPDSIRIDAILIDLFPDNKVKNFKHIENITDS